MSDGLKSRLELAMERLRQQDEAAGITQQALTDAQRAAIAEVRSLYDSKLAEAEVLHQGKLRSTWDPEARELLEQEYRHTRERLSADRDNKIEKLRASAG